jgi:hypothetical protein
VQTGRQLPEESGRPISPYGQDKIANPLTAYGVFGVGRDGGFAVDARWLNPLPLGLMRGRSRCQVYRFCGLSLCLKHPLLYGAAVWTSMPDRDTEACKPAVQRGEIVC